MSESKRVMRLMVTIDLEMALEKVRELLLRRYDDVSVTTTINDGVAVYRVEAGPTMLHS